MKKRLLSVVMILALCLALLPATAAAAPTGTKLTTAHSGQELHDNNYYLDGDVELTDGITFSNFGGATLDLNGHVLSLKSGVTNSSVIATTGSTNLTITDSSPSVLHKFDKSNPLWKWVSDSATGSNIETIYGGVITGGNHTETNADKDKDNPYGGGIMIRAYGNVKMIAGTIVGCTALYGGGVGIPTQEAKFTMSGNSRICGCTETSQYCGNAGSAIRIANMYSVMYADGGTVDGNVSATCSGESGGIKRSATGTDINSYTTFNGDVDAQNFDNNAKLKIDFDANGGSPKPSDQYVAKGQKLSTPSPMPEREGYTLTKWTRYDNGQAFDINSGKVTFSTTLKANWTENQYTIRYNGQGATGTMANQTGIYYTRSIQLSNNNFTKAGYSFAGWATESDGAVKYSNMATVSRLTSTNGAAVDLYAVWLPNPNTGYTVQYYYENTAGTYDIDTGKTQTPTGTTDSGINISSLAAAGAKTGFTLNSGKSTSSATIGGDGRTVVKFYFDRNRYGVTLNTNGGTINSGNVTEYTYGIGATLPTDVTKTGHTFKGWYADSNFSGDKVEKIGTADLNTKVFYAKWEANKYDVTLNTNGGTINSGNVTQYTYGIGATLPTDVTKTGHTFEGWYADENFEGVKTTAIGTTDIDEKVFYANWTINQYTVTFDSDGGSEVESQTVYYNTTATEPDIPYKIGYYFLGWYADGADKTFDFETPITDDITLTARWMLLLFPSHDIVISDTEHGTVTTDLDMAASGDIVNITVKPDEGYSLDSLTAADINGNVLDITDNGDGSYSFRMAPGEVTIEAVFKGGEIAEDAFVDVSPKNYYYDAVRWAVENGITEGMDDTHFDPDGVCTRAQAVTFLYRAAGEPTPKTTAMPFDDVSAEAYYYNAVLWAVENGITKGTSDTEFSPNDYCTRTHIVTFLYRYADIKGIAGDGALQDLVSAYNDAAMVSSYAADAMNWALAGGIVKGADGKLMPNDDCVRAQIVTMMYRLLG